MPSESRPAAAFRQYLPEGYRKKIVYVDTARRPGPASVNSYWDGGSRSDYTLFRGGVATPVSRSPGFPSFTNQQIELLPGDVFVTTGIFCGKVSCARIEFVVAAPKLTDGVTSQE